MIKTEIQIWYAIFCDECDVQGPYAANAEKASEKAEKQGWLVLSNINKHFCPEHKQIKKAGLAELDDMQVELDRLKQRNDERLRGSQPTQLDSE